MAAGRITRERACWCQRLLAGRPAHLVEPGGMTARALAMLAADVAAIGRQEATQDAQHPPAIPKADRLAVVRDELAGGEGRARRIGQDGESHPRRVLRPGEATAKLPGRVGVCVCAEKSRRMKRAHSAIPLKSAGIWLPASRSVHPAVGSER